MAYGRNYYSDHQVFIGQEGLSANEVKGVQSFDGNWSIPNSDMLAAGYEFVGSEIEGVLLGEVSVNRLIVEQNDPITSLFNSSIDGYLIYGKNESFNKVFNFKKSYINGYESSCSIGEIATANFSMSAYGGIGKMNSESRSYTNINATPAIANSIILTTPFGSTNGIQSYSLTLSIDRDPVYKIGDMFIPSQFVLSTPIKINTSFDMLVNDYESKNLFDAICSNDFIDNLSIQLKTCDGSAIQTFTLNDSKISSSSISASIGANMTANLSYQSSYSKIEDLTNVFS
tara:strand:+ start:19695 stop:20552 length:858 start_codon:yes stop_codon:yes gene_type:complete